MPAVLAQSDGFHAPGLEIFQTPCFVDFTMPVVGEVCVNRHVAYIFAAALIVITLFTLAATRSRLVPRGLQNLVESIITFIREEIALQVIGREGLTIPWIMPLLISLFAFILVANIFGVLPFIHFPATSRMAIPAFLAVLVLILFVALGFKHQGLGYLRNVLFPPGVPKPVYLLLTPIELVSTFLVRPLTLSVRLLANMMAGHLVLTIFFLGSAYLFSHPPYVFGVPAFALAVALVAFEILVAVLQAYIFTILTAVYIAGAIHPEH